MKDVIKWVTTPKGCKLCKFRSETGFSCKLVECCYKCKR